MATIQGVYVALFGRPADPLGLAYWKGVTDDGANLSKIGDLAQTQEYQDRFAGQSNAQVVNSIFQSLFNRDADVAGLTFWVNGLNSGEFTVNDVAIRILDGAQGSDKTTVENKVAAADKFTASLDTTAEILAYSGNAAAGQGRAFLAPVTTDVPADAAVDAAVQAIVDGYSGPVGANFILTPGADFADVSSSYKNGGLISSDFKFSAGNETVTAGAGTLNNTDVLIDNSTTDNDTLNATLTSGAATTALIQNIENINLIASVANSGVDFATVTGVKAVKLGGTANAQLVNLNAAAAPTIELNNYTSVATISAATLAGTKDALSVKVSGATATATVIPGIVLDTAVAGALETLNLESAGASKNTVNLSLGGTITGVTKSVVTGAADLDLRVAHGLVSGQTLDASGHAGALNLIVDRNGQTTATTNLTNVTGVDTFTFRDSTAGGDALVASGLASGSNVVLTYGTLGASTLTVRGAATGTADSINLTLDHATDATNVAVATSLTIADVETVNIKSEGGTTAGNSIAGLTVSAGSTVNVDGSTKLDLTLAATSTVSTVNLTGSGAHAVKFAAAATYSEGKHLTIDGSAATGKLTIDGSFFQGTALGVAETITIKGGTTDDTITGSSDANAKNVIEAGAGVDTVNVSTANNSTVSLGEGADKLNITGVTGAGSVSITDFALGSAGDVLSVNTAGAVTFAGVAAAATIGTLTVLSAAENDNAAIATKLNAIVDGAGEAAVLVINNSTGIAELWYDADTNNDASAIVKLASFENITTVGQLTDATGGFVAANFGTWA